MYSYIILEESLGGRKEIILWEEMSAGGPFAKGLKDGQSSTAQEERVESVTGVIVQVPGVQEGQESGSGCALEGVAGV